MKKFLVVIDTQYDFMMADGKLPVPGAEEIIVDGIGMLANLDPQVYDGVLFTFDTHEPTVYAKSPEAEQFPIHCVKGTPGWENVFNINLVDLDVGTWTLEKGVFNMWEEPSELIMIEDGDPTNHWKRDDFFGDIREDAEPGIIDPRTHEIEIMGVAADFCVFWAIQGFVDRGFKVTILGGLTKGIVRSMSQVVEEEFANTDRVLLGI
jgi:nicotinamidase/pyrazinamidase